MRFASLLGVSLLVVGHAAAQSAVNHTRTFPDIYTGSYAGSGNAFPMGRTKGFIQFWVRGDTFPGMAPVLQVGWRVYQTGSAHKEKIEIVMDSVTVGFATLSKTFASNLTASKTVFLALKDVNFPAITVKPTNPDVPAVWIPGDKPFVRLPTRDVIIQVDIQTETTPRSIGYYADSIRSAQNSFINSDPSCGGKMTGSYSGTTLGIAHRGAPPGATALFLIGLKLFAADLGALIGPGCNLHVNPLFVLALPTDASGNAALTANFPIGATDTLALHAQAVHLKNNALASSDVLHMSVGTAGLMTYLYNWTTFTSIAQYGPYTTNRGPVVLFR